MTNALAGSISPVVVVSVFRRDWLRFHSASQRARHERHGSAERSAASTGGSATGVTLRLRSVVSSPALHCPFAEPPVEARPEL